MSDFCCAMLGEHAGTSCTVHGENCMDIVIRLYPSGDWGLPIHDGSYIKAKYCPWCGSKLSHTTLRLNNPAKPSPLCPVHNSDPDAVLIGCPCND